MARTNRDLEWQIGKGHASSSFLQDPLFVQAVEDVKTTIFNRWVYTESSEVDKREQLWMQWHNMDELLQALRKPVGEATLATAERDANRYRQRMENS